jgi:hypothetical protein
MATVNPPRAHRTRTGLAVAAAILFGLIAFFWKPLNGYASTGASYGARVACSCHYVGGRSLSDCAKDFESGMELVMLSADEDAKSVTARFPLLSRQTAAYREGEGCRLEPWDK